MTKKDIYPTSSKNSEKFFKLLDKIKRGSGRGFEGHIYLLMEGDEQVGKIIIRCTDCSDGIRCETGFHLDGYLADRKTYANPLYWVEKCEGYGYNMESENMMTILARLRDWMLERGFSYLSPSERDYNFYMVNHWEDVFKQRGIRLVRAM